jgi:hypothetical protein
MPAGAPKPWNQPFSAHKTTQIHSTVENPMPMLISADINNPKAKNTFMLA